MNPSLTEKNNQSVRPIIAVRIYLTITKVQNIIHIQQHSKHLDGSSFLQRHRKVKKPDERHIKIALNGTIQTTINYYRKHHKKKVTHIGI